MYGIVVIYIVLWAIWIACCALLAKRQKRSVFTACVLGFFFGFFAVIAYAIANRIKVK
jgi:hypothetical protein